MCDLLVFGPGSSLTISFFGCQAQFFFLFFFTRCGHDRVLLYFVCDFIPHSQNAFKCHCCRCCWAVANHDFVEAYACQSLLVQYPFWEFTVCIEWCVCGGGLGGSKLVVGFEHPVNLTATSQDELDGTKCGIGQ